MAERFEIINKIIRTYDQGAKEQEQDLALAVPVSVRDYLPKVLIS